VSRCDPVLSLAGSAYFVDLFLRWGPPRAAGLGGTFTGWDLTIAVASGETVVALLLVEVVRATGIWRTPGSALLTFFLAAGTAILAVSALVHLRWGGFYHLAFGDFGYGAWVGLTLAVALAAGAILYLGENGARLGRRELVGPAT
jgi:hypothetical protein